MQFSRRFWLFFLVLAVLGAGCSGSQVKKDEITPEMAALPAYFQEVPADTLFFFGGGEPIPQELLADTLKTLDTFLAGGALEVDEPEVIELGGATQLADGFTQVMSAEPEPIWPQLADILRFMSDEMGGEISAEGLSELGIAPEPLAAAYAVGFLPVLRVELGDTEKFAAFVERAEAAYGLKPEAMSLEGETYRAYPSYDGSSQIMLRINDDEAVLSVVSEELSELFLPYFLGLKKPRKSMAHDNHFKRVSEAHGFHPYAAAYIDMERVTAWIAQDFGEVDAEDLDINEAILSKLDIGEEMGFGPECPAEYQRVAAMAPLVVGGVREYDQETLDIAAGVALEADLAAQLADSIAGVPGSESAFAENSLFTMGFGVDLDAFLSLMESQAQEVQREPFKCGDFLEFNELADNILMSSAQLPPALRSFTGLNIILRNLQLDWSAAEPHIAQFVPRVLGAFRSENPPALLKMALMFVPEGALEEDVQPGGEPAPLDIASSIYEGIVEPMILMGDQAIAIFAGPKMLAEAEKIAAEKPAGSAAAFLIRLNAGEPLIELLAEAERMVNEAEEDADERGLSAEEIASAREGLSLIERYLADERATMALSVEANRGGVLLGWRTEGEGEFIAGLKELSEGTGEPIDALLFVLGH